MTRSRPASRARRLLRLAATACLTLGLGAMSASGYEGTGLPEDPARPGLPLYETEGAWITPKSTSSNHVTAARQWLRPPPIQTIARTPKALAGRNDPNCRFSEHARSNTYTADINLVSTRGSAERFGTIGPFPARTLAFGSIPVEAEVVLEQLRDERDLPIPLRFRQLNGQTCAHTAGHPPAPGTPLVWEPASVTGPLQLSVRALRVDGVDLELAAGCRPATPSDLTLTSRRHHDWDPELPDGTILDPGDIDGLMRTDYYIAPNGGLLFGTITIPGFTGCRTPAGEDVSRLLTASVSGSENRVEMRTTGITGEATTDGCAWENTCTPLPEMPLPAR